MQLANNLAHLREKVPFFYQQIFNDKPDLESYRVTNAKRVSTPIIEVNIGGRWTAIHSQFQPLEEASRWVKSLSFKNQSPEHIFLFGFGFGYQVQELIRAYPDAKFYIFEPDKNILLHALHYIDFSKFPWQRIENFLVDDFSINLEKLIQGLISKVNNLDFISPPIYQKIYQAEYNQLYEIFKNQKDNYVFGLKSNLIFEKEWTTNAIKNLKNVLSTSSIFRFKEYFEGKSVIMTASGPSLEDILPLIKEVQEQQKTFIVSAGTSVNVLLKHGITPDMFLSYDPRLGNYTALKETITEKPVPLVFGSTIYHQIADEHRGEKAHFILSQDTIYPFLNPSWDSQEIIFDSPTIAAVTLQVLIKLGVKQIFLAGQDLAFIDDKYYAVGAQSLRSQFATEEERKSWVEVENNLGKKSLTSESFLRMKDSLEGVIGYYKYQNVYNLSPKGAKIKGTSFVTTEETWKKIYTESVPKLNFNQTKEDGTKKYFEAIRKIKKNIRYYRKHALLLEKLVDDLKKAKEGFRDLKLFFQAIDDCLDNKLTKRKDFDYLVAPFVRVRFHLAARTIENIRSKYKNEDIYDQTEELYNYYVKEIGALIGELKDVFAIYDSID